MRSFISSSILLFNLLSVISAFRASGPRGYTRLTKSRLSMFHELHEPILQAMNMDTHNIAHNILQNSFVVAEEAVSQYQKVDKTGVIGFVADIIEKAIDFGHTALQKTGIKNTYGYSICLFTLLLKLLTLPLTTQQLESTTKMQKLTPLQQKINAKYADDEQTKNQLIAKLFQTANVNPLAGCLPALVQLPIFLSLYRALTNLVAENKLDEPFLWIPDLEGPVYQAGPGSSMDWIKSVFSGTPSLGWEDTIAFCSIPIILFISQSVSMKVLQPPKDPNKVMTDQELTTQGVLNNLPFIIAFFSLNVPAGLGVYWILNNFLTTAFTAAIKGTFKNDELPAEVEKMMAEINSDSKGAMKAKVAASSQELRRPTFADDRPKSEGFGKFSSGAVLNAEVVMEGSSSSSNSNAVEKIDSADDGELDSDDAEQDNDVNDSDTDRKGKKKNKPQTPKKRKDGKK